MARAPAIGLAERALRNQFLTPLTHHGVEGQDRVFTVSDDDGNQGKVRVRRVSGDRCRVLPYRQAQRNPERPVPDYALGEPEILEKATVRSWLPWRVYAGGGKHTSSGTRRVTASPRGYWSYGHGYSIPAGAIEFGREARLPNRLAVHIFSRVSAPRLLRGNRQTHVWDVVALLPDHLRPEGLPAKHWKRSEESLEEAIRAAEDWFTQTASALELMKQVAKGSTTVDMVLRRFPHKFHSEGNDTIEVSWSIDEGKAKGNSSFRPPANKERIPPKHKIEEYIEKVSKLDTWIPILTWTGKRPGRQGKVERVFKRYEVEVGEVTYRFFYLHGSQLWFLTASGLRHERSWRRGPAIAQTETLEDMVRFLEGYLPEHHPIWSMQAAAKKAKKKGAKKNPKGPGDYAAPGWISSETVAAILSKTWVPLKLSRHADQRSWRQSSFWVDAGGINYSVRYLHGRRKWVLRPTPMPEWVSFGRPLALTDTMEEMVEFLEDYLPTYHPVWSMRAAAAAGMSKEVEQAEENPKPEVVQSWIPWDIGRRRFMSYSAKGKDRGDVAPRRGLLQGLVSLPVYLPSYADPLDRQHELEVDHPGGGFKIWTTNQTDGSLQREGQERRYSLYYNAVLQHIGLSLEEVVRVAEKMVAEDNWRWAMKQAAEQEVYTLSYPNNQIGPSVQVTRKAKKNPRRGRMREQPYYTVLWEHSRGQRGDLMGLPGAGEVTIYRYPDSYTGRMEPLSHTMARVGKLIRQLEIVGGVKRSKIMVLDRQGQEQPLDGFIRSYNKVYDEGYLIRGNPYRSAVIAMPTSAQLAMLNGPKLYDPREWQINAQAMQIYMQSLDGRDARKLSQPQINKLVSRAFQIATGVEQKAPKPKTVKRGGRKVEVRKSEWVKKGTRTPTARTRKASKERYAGTYVGTDGKRRTLASLVLGRQCYELMLAMRRKKRATTDFYRVVPEVTTCGILYFVWPLPPGANLPGPAQTDYQAAAAVAADLNQRANPYKTGEWWQSGKRRYTKNELSYWLPPEKAFDANFDAKAFDAKMKRPWGGRRRSTA